MTNVAFKDHTDALVLLLADVGVPVGDADASGLTPPYLILDRGPSPSDGPLDDPYADAFLEYQVSCVSDSRVAAEDLADKTRWVVLGGLTVGGRSIARIEHIGGRGVARYTAGGVEYFMSTEEFRLWSTPRAEEGS